MWMRYGLLCAVRLAAVAAPWVTVNTAHARGRTPSCTRCDSSCGGGYQEITVGTTYRLCCIDFDRNPPAHCCTTERQEREQWTIPPPFPATLEGYCYAYVCGGATPTQYTCQNAGCT